MEKTAFFTAMKERGGGTSDDILSSEGDGEEKDSCRAPEFLLGNYTNSKMLKFQTKEGVEISQGRSTNTNTPIYLIETKRPRMSLLHIRFSKKHRNKLAGITRNDNDSTLVKEKQFITKDAILGHCRYFQGYGNAVEEHQRDSANTEPANASAKDGFLEIEVDSASPLLTLSK